MLFADLIQVLDPEPHPAALNMAFDEALLRTASAPLLRIYRWLRPAVSFGYFGKWSVVAESWPGRELVRRWTGGGIVPHGEDLTYSLIVPQTHPFFGMNPLESYRLIHETIAAAVGQASLAAEPATKISDSCFENAARFDLVIAGRKIAGAAQRRTKMGLLHQGSIQPVEDWHRVAESLPGGFTSNLRRVPLTAQVRAVAARIAEERYGTDAWTRRW